MKPCLIYNLQFIFLLPVKSYVFFVEHNIACLFFCTQWNLLFFLTDGKIFCFLWREIYHDTGYASSDLLAIAIKIMQIFSEKNGKVWTESLHEVVGL
jgi:hypothetical protein